MATRDNITISWLHGEAMRRASEHSDIDAAIQELRLIATGRNDLLAETAGIFAGSWCADPATHHPYELVGCGLLAMAGSPLDFTLLEQFTVKGYNRGLMSRQNPHTTQSLHRRP